MAKPVLQIIIGSTRPGRVGRAVADWIIDRARARGDFEVVVNKPAGVVSYGGVAAGTRATQMLKQVLSALKVVVVTDSVNIPFVREKLDEDGRLKPNEIMEQAAAAMLDELARWAQALRPLRSAATTP